MGRRPENRFTVAHFPEFGCFAAKLPACVYSRAQCSLPYTIICTDSNQSMTSMRAIHGKVEKRHGVTRRPLAAATSLLPLLMLALSAALSGTVAQDAPGAIRDLRCWALQLPPGRTRRPDVVRGRAIAQVDRFGARWTPAGLELTANAGGVTTGGSRHARSELRELNVNGNRASWTTRDGREHRMVLVTTVTRLPAAEPAATIMQIKDNNGNRDNLGIEVVPLRSRGVLRDGLRLQATYSNPRKDVVIDPNYKLGQEIDLVIIAQNGRLTIDYNGKRVIDDRYSLRGGYFKAGMYAQFGSEDSGVRPGDLGTVVISKLDVSHK